MTVARRAWNMRRRSPSGTIWPERAIERALSDARMALAFLARQPGVDGARLGVVGMSLGGLVAAGVASTQPDVHALVLWSAVAHNGDRVAVWMMWEKRKHLRRHGYYDDGGWAINRIFDEQLSAMDGAEMVVPYRGPALILHGAADTTVPIEDAHRYKKVLGVREELVAIDDADHIYWMRQNSDVGGWQGEVWAA